MKTLFIAEKPSLAKEYKSLLEKNLNQSFSQKDGYFESSQFFISWCFGHLVTLGDPAAYGWEEWSIENLPMIPEQWKYQTKGDSGAKKQFNTLKKLLSQSSEVINGADPDREGELIVRLVLHLSGKTKLPQKRFWARSLTHKDLTTAWNTMKSAKEYNNLFSSASCRQRADWLVGMNLSRAYSIKSNVRGVSIGRVQTPTLNMIVERDLEIENWKQSFYQEIHSVWMETELKYIGTEPNGNIVEFINDQEKNQAQRIVQELQGNEFKTHSLKPTTKIQHPPLFYNLADIQKDANKAFGYTADKTLSLVQSLYEKKLLSYPRTDCNYVTEDMRQECSQLLQQLISDEFDTSLINSESPKSFNSKKVTAHTALIPVSVADLTKLSSDEVKIYNLAAKRFIVAQLIPSESLATELVISDNKHYFKTTHTELKTPGFKSYLSEENKSTPFNSSITDSTSSKLDKVEIVEKERQKPKHFTESTLLSAMENCSRRVEDDELKDVLKRVEGIGTPATRSGTIETLKRRSYIEQKGKNLISTEKGRSLISFVDVKIKSPELTAQWESLLHDIEHGTADWKPFYNDIVKYTKEVVTDVLNTETLEIVTKENKQHQCPKCNESTLKINKAGAFCDPCDFKFWRKQFGKTLSDKAFNDLLYKGKTSKMKFTSKNKKKYDARLTRNNDFNVELSFD